MKSANPESKHIAKAAQANAKTKALSKSLLCPPKKKNKKISTASQKLNLPINEPTDQNNLTIKEIKQLTNSEISTDERRTTTHNSVYVTIAGEVVNRRSVLLKNFVLYGQESASNPLQPSAKPLVAIRPDQIFHMKKTLTFSILLFISIHGSAQQRFITIDESKIWINTIGLENRKPDQPVIVFESGHGTPMGNWDRVLAESSNLGPIVTYDRPGVGESEPIEEMPTVKNVADRLIKILEHLEQEPPYLLVGHSLGSVYVRGFAVYYPEKLAGLVIIDPGDFTETKENEREYYKVLGWSEQRIDQELDNLRQKSDERNESIPAPLRRERQVLSKLRQDNFKEISESPLPNIPVHILTGGRFDMPECMRSKEFDNEVLFRSKMQYRVARWINVIQSVDKGMMFYSGDAGHFVHWDDPELAIASIKIVLKDYAEMNKL